MKNIWWIRNPVDTPHIQMGTLYSSKWQATIQYNKQDQNGKLETVPPKILEQPVFKVLPLDEICAYITNKQSFKENSTDKLLSVEFSDFLVGQKVFVIYTYEGPDAEAERFPMMYDTMGKANSAVKKHGLHTSYPLVIVGSVEVTEELYGENPPKVQEALVVELPW